MQQKKMLKRMPLLRSSPIAQRAGFAKLQAVAAFSWCPRYCCNSTQPVLTGGSHPLPLLAMVHTHLQVAKHFKGDADIKLVDAGNMRLSDMRGKDERKLGLLRRCDLLVHTVRCFDLYKPKLSKTWKGGGEEGEDGEEGNAEEGARISLTSNLGGGVGGADGEGVEGEIAWPLSPTPLEDVRGTRAEMAYADLQFIEERQK